MNGGEIENGPYEVPVRGVYALENANDARLTSSIATPSRARAKIEQDHYFQIVTTHPASDLS
jgi:hypothetical protein